MKSFMYKFYNLLKMNISEFTISKLAYKSRHIEPDQNNFLT